MDNLKGAYSLTPFTNKEVPEFSHQGPSLPIQALPFWSVFKLHRGCSLGGGEGGLTMALLSTTIHQHDWSVNASLQTHRPYPAADGPERVTGTHRKASPSRTPPHEANTV